MNFELQVVNPKSVVIILLFIGCCASLYVFRRFIFPIISCYGLKEIERNPKWVTSQLSKYYGFGDIDIVLCESIWNVLPRFKSGKNFRVELWIPKDISFDEVEYFR